MLKAPEDVRGVPLTIGSLVCFTTNSRDSGLQFGRVASIKEKDGRYSVSNGDGTYTKSKEFRVSMFITDVEGNTVFEQVYDPEAPNPHNVNNNYKGAFVDTEKPAKSGQVLFEGKKFLAL